MAFFRILLIIIIVYYLLKFVARYLFPRLLRYMLKRMGAQTGQNFANPHQQRQKSDGEISIDYIPKTEKQTQIESGEYVDYEEVK